MFNAVIAGNIGAKNAETKQLGSSSVTEWSVAVEQRTKDGKTTTWVDCSLWGKRGETLAQYLTKGSKVCVSGELTTREHNGKTYLKLNASDVTLMGGKPEGGQSSGGSDYGQQSSGYGGGHRIEGGQRDIDDEIPF